MILFQLRQITIGKGSLTMQRSIDDSAMKYAEEKRRSYGIDCSVMIRDDVISWLSKLGQDSLVKIIKRFY
jgi:hypothetical protein